MALAFTGITAAKFTSNTDTSSYPSGSFTPPSNTLAGFAIYQICTTGTPTVPTPSGDSLTWTQIATVQGTAATSTRYRLTVFAANTSGATTGSITITFAGQTQSQCAGLFFQIDGSDYINGIAQTFVQVVTGESTAANSISLALAAASNANNRLLAFFLEGGGAGSPVAVTPRTNWNELDETSGTVDFFLAECQARSDAFETTASASGASSTVNWLGMALEVKAANTFIATRSLVVNQAVKRAAYY